LAHSKLDVAYQSLAISSTADTEALSQLLQNYHPKLVLTLGTPATRASLIQIKDIPIVAGMILDTEELRRNTNSTGVGLNFSASLQWLWLRRLLPDARQIAVLYDPHLSTALFHALQTQAQTEGITLIQAPTDSAETFPALMENLPPQLDALWAVDGAAYNTASIRELLLYSFRNRAPLIGLSAQWVKAGALYALDWNYSDLGAQAADLAKDILLKGTPPATLLPVSAREVRPVLNIQTAEQMKLHISERWLHEMSEVFK
jgi:putative ABC transport system substrate-binding protein